MAHPSNNNDFWGDAAMPTFTGTNGNDIIEPGLMSGGVTAVGALSPTSGIDTLDGGAGDDALQGGGGNDLILGGLGNDYVFWFSGDGSDSINGGAGVDAVQFQLFGTTGVINSNDVFNLTSNSAGVVSAAINGVDTVRMSQVESIFVAPWDGADNISIGDLSLSGVGEVDVTLQSINATPDFAVDTVTVAGSAGSDTFQIFPMQTSLGWTEQVWINNPNGHNLAVNLDFIENGDRLVLNLGGGDDVIWDWASLAIGQLTINGEAGNDFIFGTPGAETLTGGTGNDTVQGWGGGDSLSGDAGNDSIQSFSATGFDTLSGGGGNDSIQATGGGDSLSGGANDDIVHWQWNGGMWTGLATGAMDGGTGADTFASDDPTDGMGGWVTSLLTTGGGHAFLSMGQRVFQFGSQINLASASFDLLNVETLRLTGTGVGNGGGLFSGIDNAFFITEDSFAIGDLTGTAIRELDIDLGGNPAFGPASGDGALDSVSLTGSSAAEHVVFSSPGAGMLQIAGLLEKVVLSHVDFQEALSLRTGGGNDTIDLSMDLSPAAGPSQMTVLDGGAGADTLNVSAGAIGPSPRMAVFGNGTHAEVQAFSLAPFSPEKDLDLQNIETVNLIGSSGFDSFFVGGLASTAVRTVTVDMGALAGAPDGSQDQLTIAGDDLGDRVTGVSTNGVVTVTGLPASVTVLNAGANDFFEVVTGAGNDLIDFSQVTTTVWTSERGGSGNDTIIGSAGAPTAGFDASISGEAGDDSIAGGAGTTFIRGGPGFDTISTSGGHTTKIWLQSNEAGADTILNFHTHAVAGAAGDVLQLSGFSETTVTQFLADGHLIQSGANLQIWNGTHLLGTLVGVSSLTAADILLG